MACIGPQALNAAMLQYQALKQKDRADTMRQVIPMNETSH